MTPDDDDSLAERGYAELVRKYAAEVEHARTAARKLAAQIPPAPDAAIEPVQIYRLDR